MLIGDAHNTSLVSIASASNTLTKRYQDPFGNTRGTTAAWQGDHGFLDKPVDTSGLTQIGARYYDGVLGAFISVDPLLDLTDPQQWNGYAYANNNPTTWSDPTGLIIGTIGDWSGGGSQGGSWTPPPAPEPPAAPVQEPSKNPFQKFGSWVGDTWDYYLTDGNGENVVVNALQSWGAGAVDGTIAMADMVTPGSLPRIGNPNTDSIYGASYTIGEWDGPANLIGAGGAFKGARLVQGLTSRITAANKLAAGTKVASNARLLARADRIEQHLARPEFVRAPQNDAMLARIRSAATEGASLSRADRAFMRHELTENWLMNRGLGARPAHRIAGWTHPTFGNYDPTVIKQFPQNFSPGWKNYWGIE